MFESFPVLETIYLRKTNGRQTHIALASYSAESYMMSCFPPIVLYCPARVPADEASFFQSEWFSAINDQTSGNVRKKAFT